MTNETNKKLLTRGEVKVEETWRLEDIFSTDESWEEEYRAIEEFAKKGETFKGTLGNGGRCTF